ncbi:L-type lectin-domain containing receptor kinase IX.1-like [Papaver somniferum]|uniref:L-type lectin-domain containing receptor kinase IX.1-like n=1 Tax=Papaver somniferum TaxID=3469 RepID=UPI000E6F5416|nr:L-type lectin-domain containing receptor kinase IX.1-like [Papaver somniferum]
MALYYTVLIPSVFFFLCISTVNSVSFNISSFKPGNKDVNLFGTSNYSRGNIELTNPISDQCIGWATYKEHVPLWHSGNLFDFTTHFTFSINGQDLYHGEGIAFFLAPVGFHIPLNSPAKHLGLFNETTYNSPSLNQIIAVEFDTHHENENWDVQHDHVGIDHNSLISVVNTTWNFTLGETYHAWITYNSTTKNLSVYWTYENNTIFRGDSLLSYLIDLKEVLPQNVMVGFSASSGFVNGTHTLLSWEFNSSLAAKKKEINKKLVVGLTVPGALILIFGIGVALIMLKKPKDKKPAILIPAGPRSFSYKNLVSATNNFCQERKLGEGGFGGVYQGRLNDSDQPVAVKKFTRGSSQGTKEYINEVTIISQLSHRNLLQLIGWCHEKKELILVYELMPNGSLDSYLSGKRNHLVWAIRYKVALGLANALLYLHEEWGKCVLHRDIKSSNVLLDSNFDPKLGDFGLARFMDHDRFSQSTGLAGTFGYLAPEYISTGRPSKDSDVFSFGVVALEIVCGRKSFVSFGEISQMGLVELVWDLYGKGKLSAAVDKKLGNDFDSEEAERLMILGLWCAHPDRSFRPSIRQAIQVLNKELSLPILPPKMPVPLYHVPEIVLASYSTSLDDIGR